VNGVVFLMHRLSHAMKKKIDKVIHERGDKYECFYNGCTFSPVNPAEYEHLNSNVGDNRPENIVYACKVCNNRKKFDFDMQIKAQEKLIDNEKAVLASERTIADSGTENDLTSQQEINRTNMNITRTFLLEHTINESVVLRDSVNAIVDICQSNNSSGSQAAIYRYIDSLANPFTGKYTISQNKEGNNIIRRRTEN